MLPVSSCLLCCVLTDFEKICVCVCAIEKGTAECRLQVRLCIVQVKMAAEGTEEILCTSVGTAFTALRCSVGPQFLLGPVNQLHSVTLVLLFHLSPPTFQHLLNWYLFSTKFYAGSCSRAGRRNFHYRARWEG